MVPETVPAVEVDRQIRDHFAIEDKVILVIETAHTDGIFNTSTLKRVVEITTRLLAIDGVDARNIISLATEKSGRRGPGRGNFPTFLDPVPATREAIAQTR